MKKLFGNWTYLFKLTAKEYEASINALNIFFGAVIGISLGSIGDIPTLGYVQLLVITSAAVTSILFLCYSYSIPLLFLFYSYSIPLLFLFYSYSIPLLFLFYPFAIPLLFLCYSYSIPMLFPFYSNVVPMLFLFSPTRTNEKIQLFYL